MNLSSVAESMDRFTYADYLTWDNSVRYELIYGIPHMMSAPSPWHQRTVRGLFTQIEGYLRGKPCEPFFAPIDVRLYPAPDNQDMVVVQPDILVVCDKSKVGKQAIEGPPDFIIEIVSPASKVMDMEDKRRLYLAAGVREYWIVGRDTVIKLVNDNGEWEEAIVKFGENQMEVPAAIFDGCVLNLGMGDEWGSGE
ncbi:MAG: Uma2 family endonuclease [Treponema sp.]|nr:Uma2 family endonuclease [Treponema sp.]